MRVTTTLTDLSDALYNAEELYDDLLALGQVIPAASVKDAVDDLRRKVREGNGDD